MQIMTNKIKTILLTILLISGISNLNAQYSISTPYSRYGIGKMAGTSSQVAAAMGGVGCAMARNNEVNTLNPASYFAIDSQSFVFNIGFDMNWRNIKSSEDKSNAFLAGINNISFSFPIIKGLRVGLSLMPVSDIKYLGTDSVFSTYNYTKVFEGNGGLDKFVVGLAYQILNTKNDMLAIGANMDYYFGNIYRAASLEFLTSQRDNNGNYNDTLGFFNSRTETNYNISSFGFDFGLQYFHSLTNGNIVGLGLVFTPSYKFNADKKQLFYTYYRHAANEYMMDTIQNKSSDADIKMPMHMGLGFSFEKPNKLFAEADCQYYKCSDFYFENKDKSQELKDSWTFNIGSEYIPNYLGSSYFDKIAYRIGMHYSNGYIYLQDKRINDIGISFGMGLQIKKLGTRINLNFEYGKFGTTDNNLIKENYFRIGVAVSAKDRWFVKRKYK